METMRIAMISMHTSPLQQPGSGDAGGLNVYVLETAQQLAERGIDVDIFTRAVSASQGEIVTVAPHLRVINIVAGPYEGLEKESLPTQMVAFAGGILLFSEGIHYDFIHSHYWLSGQVGWLLRDLWHIPLIHTAHTLAAAKNSHLAEDDTPESEARRICEQQVVDNADRLVVNTVQEREDLLVHYDAQVGKISVVQPGADTALFSPGSGRATERARRELGIPLHTKVIAFVGRLQQHKGPQVLIDAVAELLSRNPQRKLVVLICGGASGRAATPEFYQDMAVQRGLGRRVRFLKPRPPQDLVDIYRAADVVAVPSYNESFGLVAVEAQASGTPVVAARVGGLPIAVSEGVSGLLVGTHDPSDWADALTTLLDHDDLRQEMGRNAVKHAAKFSWAETADKLVDIYCSLKGVQVPGDTVRKPLG